MASVARTWTTSSPAEASAWIGSLADPGARNAATAAFSSMLARTDPASAAQWATSITDNGARGRTISQVVSEWKKSDSPAAMAFVQSTPTIDNNLRKRLLR